jgi:hypothetical protein
MANSILLKVQAIAGPGMVESVEFRIGTPRRGPKVAFAFDGADDRADGITDPIFKQIYLASRAESERVEALRMRISA